MRSFFDAVVVHGLHYEANADGSFDPTGNERAMVGDFHNKLRGRVAHALWLLQEYNPEGHLLIFHANGELTRDAPASVKALKAMMWDTPNELLDHFGLSTKFAWDKLQGATILPAQTTADEKNGIWDTFPNQRVVIVSSDYHMPRCFQMVEEERKRRGLRGATIAEAAPSTLRPEMLAQVSITEPPQITIDPRWKLRPDLRPEALLPLIWGAVRQGDKANLAAARVALTRE